LRALTDDANGPPRPFSPLVGRGAATHGSRWVRTIPPPSSTHSGRPRHNRPMPLRKERRPDEQGMPSDGRHGRKFQRTPTIPQASTEETVQFATHQRRTRSNNASYRQSRDTTTYDQHRQHLSAPNTKHPIATNAQAPRARNRHNHMFAPTTATSEGRSSAYIR